MFSQDIGGGETEKEGKLGNSLIYTLESRVGGRCLCFVLLHCFDNRHWFVIDLFCRQYSSNAKRVIIRYRCGYLRLRQFQQLNIVFSLLTHAPETRSRAAVVFYPRGRAISLPRFVSPSTPVVRIEDDYQGHQLSAYSQRPVSFERETRYLLLHQLFRGIG